MKNPKKILITGASSGIGKEIAFYYAAKKCNLFLFGRNRERLRNVQDFCESKGAKVSIYTCDAIDKIQVETNLAKILKKHKIDLFILNAGISAGSNLTNYYSTQTRYLFDTNLIGTLNFALYIIPFMIKHNYGQIAFMSSLAGTF